MKKYIVIASILAASFAFAAPVPSPTPTPTPVPTAAPTPEPTITMPDGKAYTAADIVKTIRELQGRIDEVTNERNNYLGQMVDLNTQLQKLQQQIQQLQRAQAVPLPAPK